MVNNFADRLMDGIEKTNPIVVGLDPRLDQIPTFVFGKRWDRKLMTSDVKIENALTDFNKIILETTHDLIPIIKPQLAFYEMYGIWGMKALQNTLTMAKEFNVQVIWDGKRNDIGSTAEAYAKGWLGKSKIFGPKEWERIEEAMWDLDALTVNPFLGEDSMLPFLEACKKYGKWIFVLAKTSNPGSVDFQDQFLTATEAPAFYKFAEMIDRIGKEVVGNSGYSSIGSVVWATFPDQAVELRKCMPQSIILVPGYGAQWGTGKDTIPSFNEDKKWAIVNASRSITFFKDMNPAISEENYREEVRTRLVAMVDDIKGALDN